jgi:hypothetical protein
MAFDVSHRDRHGFLQGTIEPGRLAYTIEVRPDVRPFLFPCSQCKRVAFHVAAEQHVGFMGRAFHALCNDCMTINSRLTEELVEKLKTRVLPIQICNLFMQVCRADQPVPYSAEFIEQWIQAVPADRTDLRTAVRGTLRCYALETDTAAQRQSLCWACCERVSPDKKLNGFFARTPATFLCPKCGREVPPPVIA